MPAARTVTERKLTSIVVQLLTATGMPEEHARKAAYVLITGEMRGLAAHGLELLCGNIRRLRGGSLNPRPDIRNVGEIGSLTLLDGDRGMGMVVGAVGMDLAIEAARRAGLGWVMIRRSNHYGACGSFAMMAVEQGMIGISISNCGPIMAVEGALSRVIGNNPIAIGAPWRGFPLVLDMAMSSTALGRVILMERDGKPVPDEWFVKPFVTASQAVLKPIGGPKGSGLAIMMEVLTSVVSGGDVPLPGGETSHTQIALDPVRLIPKERYEATIEQLVTRLKSAERAPGIDEVRLPGEYEWRLTEKMRREGIPLAGGIVADMERTAAELGTTISWD